MNYRLSIVVIFLLLFPIISNGAVYSLENNKDEKTGNIEEIELSLKWNFPTGHYIQASPSVFDFNDDGMVEILMGSLDGYLYCLDSDGNEMWLSYI